MAISKLDSPLFAPQFSDPLVSKEFSDERFVARLVEVEAALARVQGWLGVIPSSAAERIASVASSVRIDMERLSRETEKDGFPIVDLVKQLREAVGGEAAAYVHWGGTTQDIMDTATLLQLRAVLEHLEQNLARLIRNLTALAQEHRGTLMAGRTHSQQALPIPFGLKVAAWLAPLLRHRQRLHELKPRLLVVQFGGAAGTLASLGESGVAVEAALAKELRLGVPTMPWHAQRDSIAELGGWLSLVSASLGKMAQDVILLGQSEVGEVSESGDRSRGTSSAMPQKSNPTVSEIILSAARTNAALLSALHQAVIQEQERGTTWQVEWLTLPQMLGLTAAALNKSIWLTENLAVDTARMRENVAATRGLLLAEALSLALAPVLGRAETTALMKECVRTTMEQQRHLVDVVRQRAGKPAAKLHWERLKDETAYWGSAQAFIDRVLKEAGAVV